MSPIYEYECECGYIFEKLAYNLGDKPCPECGTLAKRIISPFTFKFTGYPPWVDRLDDRQKRQTDRGEKPTIPHIKELI